MRGRPRPSSWETRLFPRPRAPAPRALISRAEPTIRAESLAALYKYTVRAAAAGGFLFGSARPALIRSARVFVIVYYSIVVRPPLVNRGWARWGGERDRRGWLNSERLSRRAPRDNRLLNLLGVAGYCSRHTIEMYHYHFRPDFRLFLARSRPALYIRQLLGTDFTQLRKRRVSAKNSISAWTAKRSQSMFRLDWRRNVIIM